MSSDTKYINAPVLVIGLIYLTLSLISTWSLYSLVGGVPTVVIDIPLITVIGAALFLILRYINQKKDYFYFVRITYYFLILILIFICIIAILFIFVITNDEWFLFLKYTPILFGIPTIFFISKIDPNAKLEESKLIQYSRKSIFFKVIYSFILILIFLSPIVVWLILYAMRYGSDEGVTAFLLVMLVNQNAVPFMSICGIIHLIRKKKFPIDTKYLKTRLKTIIPLVIITVSSVSVSLSIIISKYFQESYKKLISANIVFYSVSVVSAFSFLILILFIQKQFIYLKNERSLQK